MLKKVAEHFGLIGDSLDGLVEKELQNPLTQLYFNLKSSPDKEFFLDLMEKYVQESRLKSVSREQQLETEEHKLTLELDIFRIINRKPYTEGDTLVFAKQALQDYVSLPDQKRSLFRKSIVTIPHKTRSFSSQKQKTRV